MRKKTPDSLYFYRTLELDDTLNDRLIDTTLAAFYALDIFEGEYKYRAHTHGGFSTTLLGSSAFRRFRQHAQTSGEFSVKSAKRRLIEALPDTRTASLSRIAVQSVVAVGTQESLSIALLLDSKELEDERDALYDTLATLSNSEPRPPELPPHVTLARLLKPIAGLKAGDTIPEAESFMPTTVDAAPVEYKVNIALTPSWQNQLQPIRLMLNPEPGA